MRRCHSREQEGIHVLWFRQLKHSVTQIFHNVQPTRDGVC